ncbi:hypothetical protein HOD38_00980 [archaeon]|mgnify:CR=1 FL=1|jgi:hypothetical protein|nr:hypothetical protein [archaeon]MBT4396817.1 hypothetical protein [archaeon]MBT4441505.1 hypothetical protein [archaeon]
MEKRRILVLALVFAVFLLLVKIGSFTGFIVIPDRNLGETTCTDSDNPGGEGYDNDQIGTFGYVRICGVSSCSYYLDACSPDGEGNQHEMTCVSGDVSMVTTVTPVSCWGGVHLGAETCTHGTCDLGNNKYCDNGAWVMMGHLYGEEDYCGLVDSDYYSTLETCSSGACDWEDKEHCYDGRWYSSAYCDDSFCGTDPYSQEYCFCEDTTLSSESAYCSDGLDNDCDGDADSEDSDCAGGCFEGDNQNCGDKGNVGICEYGSQTCSGGLWGGCVGEYSGNETEINCTNTFDDDCDGFTDLDDTECGGTETFEGACISGETRDCGTDVGVCNAGTQYCQEDGYWSICYGASYAASSLEECNGEDDDCDGETDEGCGCTHLEQQECGTNVGMCVNGTQTCEYGVWADCMGGIESFAEVCGDSLDNDCDGKIDYDDENCGGTGIVDPVVDPVVNNGSSVTEVPPEVDVVLPDEEEETDEDDEPSVPSYSNDEEGGLGFMFFLIVLFVLVILGGGVFYLYKSGKLKFKSKPKPVQKQAQPQQPRQPVQPRAMPQRPTPRVQPKKVTNPLDKALNKSFSRSKSLFKK